ncbi:hypothetical protein DYB37_004531 [Aphanomyces astaci]|uniref:Uncharacterized protein n=1 Tax=Aphanomyces astaci TaxID=112090 RepID=A0A3R6XTL6_APHAT|nr:hypothetical protein DYB37_004531 [Aphanomyces astaci]
MCDKVEITPVFTQFPSREDELRAVIAQLQAQEYAKDNKVAELECAVDTLQETVHVLQHEASLDTISALVEQYKAVQPALAQSKMEAKALQDVGKGYKRAPRD